MPIKVHRRRPARTAKGSPIKAQSNLMRISIVFDVSMFEEILKRSKKLNITFAEEVRTLVTWGMESEDAKG